MEITNVIPALHDVQASAPSSMQERVSIKMLDNAMDLDAVMSQGMVKMMENSVTPHLGGNIDINA